MATLIQILSLTSAKEFDTPPTILDADRRQLLLLPGEVKTCIKQIRQPHKRVSFVLQYLYFRISGRFFSLESFHKADIKAIAKLYGVVEFNLIGSHRGTNSLHRDQICELLRYSRNTSDIRTTLKHKADEMCRHQKSPRYILATLVEILREQRVEGLSYHALAKIIVPSQIVIIKIPKLKLC